MGCQSSMSAAGPEEAIRASGLNPYKGRRRVQLTWHYWRAVRNPRGTVVDNRD